MSERGEKRPGELEGPLPDGLSGWQSLLVLQLDYNRSRSNACNDNPKTKYRSSLKTFRGATLVAPHRTITRDYLSVTPLLRAMGFLVSRHGQLGAIPPPPFLSVSPLENMRSGGALPPPAKGVSQRYLLDTL